MGSAYTCCSMNCFHVPLTMWHSCLNKKSCKLLLYYLMCHVPFLNAHVPSVSIYISSADVVVRFPLFLSLSGTADAVIVLQCLKTVFLVLLLC